MSTSMSVEQHFRFLLQLYDFIPQEDPNEGSNEQFQNPDDIRNTPFYAHHGPAIEFLGGDAYNLNSKDIAQNGNLFSQPPTFNRRIIPKIQLHAQSLLSQFMTQYAPKTIVSKIVDSKQPIQHITQHFQELNLSNVTQPSHTTIVQILSLLQRDPFGKPLIYTGNKSGTVFLQVLQQLRDILGQSKSTYPTPTKELTNSIEILSSMLYNLCFSHLDELKPTKIKSDKSKQSKTNGAPSTQKPKSKSKPKSTPSTKTDSTSTTTPWTTPTSTPPPPIYKNQRVIHHKPKVTNGDITLLTSELYTNQIAFWTEIFSNGGNDIRTTQIAVFRGYIQTTLAHLLFQQAILITINYNPSPLMTKAAVRTITPVTCISTLFNLMAEYFPQVKFGKVPLQLTTTTESSSTSSSSVPIKIKMVKNILPPTTSTYIPPTLIPIPIKQPQQISKKVNMKQKRLQLERENQPQLYEKLPPLHYLFHYILSNTYLPPMPKTSPTSFIGFIMGIAEVINVNAQLFNHLSYFYFIILFLLRGPLVIEEMAQYQHNWHIEYDTKQQFENDNPTYNTIENDDNNITTPQSINELIAISQSTPLSPIKKGKLYTTQRPQPNQGIDCNAPDPITGFRYFNRINTLIWPKDDNGECIYNVFHDSFLHTIFGVDAKYHMNEYFLSNNDLQLITLDSFCTQYYIQTKTILNTLPTRLQDGFIIPTLSTLFHDFELWCFDLDQFSSSGANPFVNPTQLRVIKVPSTITATPTKTLTTAPTPPPATTKTTSTTTTTTTSITTTTSPIALDDPEPTELEYIMEQFFYLYPELESQLSSVYQTNFPLSLPYIILSRTLSTTILDDLPLVLSGLQYYDNDLHTNITLIEPSIIWPTIDQFIFKEHTKMYTLGSKCTYNVTYSSSTRQIEALIHAIRRKLPSNILIMLLNSIHSKELLQTITITSQQIQDHLTTDAKYDFNSFLAIMNIHDYAPEFINHIHQYFTPTIDQQSIIPQQQQQEEDKKE